ncbi:MAG: aminomethyl-transferring glycine dehydrogenase subunit GcvPA [Gammaproteobacteria bacterium]|nr:aminomethyl-transferring glycine dehydrogenase subunit GcvPA [Gammaproteobacteria bacterium]
MLDAVGVATLEELVSDVPAHARFPDLGLAAGRSEPEVAASMRRRAARNRDAALHDTFLGAGVYNHYRPATVDHVLSRGEFFTAYTPYQPEASQGMLQATFEYQSMICRLTGMEVSNASHYDGATSLAEAVMLALHAGEKGRNSILLSPGVHPHYREVVRTYLSASSATVSGDEDPQGMSAMLDRLDGRTAAVVVQTPDFFGQVERLDDVAARVHGAGALLIVVVDPVSLGLYRPPGDFGADLVVADGQCLGLAPSFGGPHLGIFATRRQYIRRLVGRLVGETVDVGSRRGYVLTLGTREQHIRREHATSNICTNAALGALAAAVYPATLGKDGLGRIAELCYHKSHYAAARIGDIPGVAINPQAPEKDFFKEFVAALPVPVAEVNRILLDEHGIIGGYDLGLVDERPAGRMLIAVTEMNTRESIDRLVDALAAACR